MLNVRVNEPIHDLHNKVLTEPLPFAMLGKLEEKSWGDIEFSLLDPNYNLLTFGQTKGKG
jgi:hypothetical protein